jgi:5-methylcytosine-specific restriction endonuclease McrA
VSGEPFSKDSQLARGARRYRRKVASAKQWQKIGDAKMGPCRVCVLPHANGHGFGLIEFHHLVSRAQGGDDVEANIVPLCSVCHTYATYREPLTLAALAASLTDAELAYCVSKLGPSALRRLFGVES